MKKKERNPSVVLHFRVKVNSPLYKWLEEQAGAAGSLSDVIRDVMEHHRLNKLDDAELYHLKRRAMLWTSIKEYLAPNMMDNFWEWYEKNS